VTEQVVRAVRVEWAAEEKADTFTSATSATRQTSDASRGLKIYLAVWRWTAREISSMEMGGIKRLARIELARMRACWCSVLSLGENWWRGCSSLMRRRSRTHEHDYGDADLYDTHHRRVRFARDARLWPTSMCHGPEMTSVILCTIQEIR
jgi:hypothetical protein